MVLNNLLLRDWKKVKVYLRFEQEVSIIQTHTQTHTGCLEVVVLNSGCNWEYLGPKRFNFTNTKPLMSS